MKNCYRATLQGNAYGLIHYDYYEPCQLEVLQEYAAQDAKPYNAKLIEIEEWQTTNEVTLKTIPKFFEPRGWTDEEAEEVEEMCSLRLGITPQDGGFDREQWMAKFYNPAETFPVNAAVAKYADRYGLDYI